MTHRNLTAAGFLQTSKAEKMKKAFILLVLSISGVASAQTKTAPAEKHEYADFNLSNMGRTCGVRNDPKNSVVELCDAMNEKIAKDSNGNNEKYRMPNLETPTVEKRGNPFKTDIDGVGVEFTGKRFKASTRF